MTRREDPNVMRRTGLGAAGLLAVLTLVGCSSGLRLRVEAPAQTEAVYSDGTYGIGVDIRPGVYSARGEQPCLVSIDGDKATPTSRITLVRSERSFTVSGGCTWTAEPRP